MGLRDYVTCIPWDYSVTRLRDYTHQQILGLQNYGITFLRQIKFFVLYRAISTTTKKTGKH